MKHKVQNTKHETFFIPKKLISILLVALCFVLCASITYAQQISLSISPPLLDVLIKPGKSILVAYRVENFGDPIIVGSKVLPFIPKDNNGNIQIKDEFEGPIQFSLDNANLKLGDSFFLKTHDSQQLLLRINVPEDVYDGDYYYSLLAQTQPPPTIEGSSSSRAQATIGSNILVTVSGSGKVDVNGKVALFDVLPHWKLDIFGRTLKLFDSNDKIPVVMIVENKGANRILPQGEIVMKGNFGETAHYDILSQNILAQSQRQLFATPSATIDCQNDSKEKACLTPTSLILSGFFIGRYLLSTTINFGEGTPNIFASTSFIALPFKFIISLFVVISVAVLIIRKIRDNQ